MLAREFLEDESNLWLQATQPLPFEEWVKRYPLGRQRELLVARQRVLSRGPTAKDARVECFLKMETTNRQVDPRNISPRSDEFLSIVGPYVSAIEHMATRCPYLVKGLSPYARANKMSVQVEHPNYIETDYSRWDLHMKSTFMSDVEHEIFRKVYPRSEHTDFYKFIDATLTTSGSHRLGALYDSELGGRCSGDAHTSIGNGICDRFLTWVCLRNIPRSLWSNFHEGDDGHTAVADAAINTARVCMAIIPCFGFSVKVVESTVLHDTTFCGRVPFVDATGYHEMCDIPRTLAKFHITLAQGDLKALLLAKAYSYYFTDRHTPIVGPLCHSLIRILAPQVKVERMLRLIKATTFSNYDRGKIISGLRSSLKPIQVNEAARAAALHRWGLPISQQHKMEQVFERMPFIPATNRDYVWLQEEITCDTDNCTYYGNTNLLL